jgi:hypothetical protein
MFLIPLGGRADFHENWPGSWETSRSFIVISIGGLRLLDSLTHICAKG